ncbi:MAG: hypothetical protein KC594_11385 [Nitrospira sp.]|nr:hypothetical protein [Nitrospira sp.]
MRWIRDAVFAVGLLCIPQGLVHAAGVPTANCALQSIRFQTSSSSLKGIQYFGTSECTIAQVGYPKTRRRAVQFTGALDLKLHSNGTIDETYQGLKASEVIFMILDHRRQADRPDPIPVKVLRRTLRCMDDPWTIDVMSELCIHEETLKDSDISRRRSDDVELYDWIAIQDFYSPKRPLGRPVTSHLTREQRALLRQQLDAWFRKEFDRLYKEEEYLQGVRNAPGTSYSANLFPSVLAPLYGQRFFVQTVVPIKLAPPKGMPVIVYLVKLERKDSTGNWVFHTTHFVYPFDAHSANGYTAFGNGEPLSSLTSPGEWRISAQVLTPRTSGWSQPVGFVVMPPPTSNNKLLKPPTRSFGK